MSAQGSDLPDSAFRAMFVGAWVAVIAVAEDGRILLANERAELLFGYAPGAMRQLPIERILSETGQALGPERLAKVAIQSRDRDVQPVFRAVGLTGDGRQFSVELGLGEVAFDATRFYVISVRDFSQSQRARYYGLIANIGDMVANVGRLMPESSNQGAAFEKILRLVSAELEVDSVAVVLRSSSGATQMRVANGLHPSLREILPRLSSSDFFDNALHVPGTPAISLNDLLDTPTAPVCRQLLDAGYADLIAIPMFDHGHPIGGLIALARSGQLFDRDKIDFLQSVANLLAATVRRGRVEEQLAYANRLDAVGQLTGGVAHDFNNLLTIISGNLQLLQAQPSDAVQAGEILASALRAVGRGAELTRKLLAFGRRQRLNPQIVDPCRQFGEIGPSLARTLGETVQVRVECAAHVPNVFVDATELDAAIINLALNARDAMPAGGTLHIGVRAHRVGSRESNNDLRSGHYVLIGVRDSGHGMSAEVLAHALEPFFTTKEAGRGNGLGLSMVYGFVKQSGGHLAIESKPGGGTRIDIYLPAVNVTVDKPSESFADVTSGGSETILVVEDEPEVRSVAVAFLRSLGYSTFEAQDAEQALQLLREHSQIALLFTDVVLGSGSNGVELMRAAKRMLPQLAVLLTSGYERPLSQAGAVVRRSTPVLRKPYRREQLAAAVRDAIERRSME